MSAGVRFKSGWPPPKGWSVNPGPHEEWREACGCAWQLHCQVVARIIATAAGTKADPFPSRRLYHSAAFGGNTEL